MIDFGKYDRKCKFKNLGANGDGYGGYIPVDTVALDTFCRSIQISGSNNIEQAQLGLPKTYRIGVQYRANFTPDTGLVVEYDGFDHKINGVELNGERQRMEWIITMIRNEH